MNGSISCPCGTRLKLPAQPVKALKCPKCGGIVRTSAPAPASAASPPDAAPAQPAPGALLSLVCPVCQKKLKVGAELAGKNIKCPGCTKVFKASAPPPPSPEEEWVDINEEAAAPPDPEPSTAPVSGDWGQDLLKGHGVPEDMKEKIRTTLTAGERLLWFDRPRMDILMRKARWVQLKGVLTGVVFGGGAWAGAYYIYFHEIRIPRLHLELHLEPPQNLIVAGILAFMGLILSLVGLYSLFAPMIQRRGTKTRACFALTNRRLLVHPGTGAQMGYGNKTDVTIVLGAGKLGVISYSGFELAGMQRVENKSFKGCGDLVFGRTLLDNPTGSHLWALNNVAEVEKLLRQKLVHPIIDKLLRGQKLSAQEKGESKQASGKPEGEAAAVGHNIKDFVAADPNLKDARVGIEQDLKKVPAEQRKKVEKEITEGEKILWIGKPEGSQKGKAKGGGILASLGKMVGMEDRREPEYTLYALTSRRVLLWATKYTSTQTGNTMNIKFADAPRGPLSYYPPHLKDAGVEEDKGGVGSILFKTIKVTVHTKTTDKRGIAHHKTHVQMHYFGILHVRKYLELARLLHDTLIAPCRGL